MVRIAPVRLAYNPKTLWFDPGELELQKDDPVVVTTARGLEFGCMAEDVFEASECQIKKLKTALKPVVRIASDEDAQRAEEMRVRSDEALPVFKEMAAEINEDMRPVSVEFLLDGDKAVFYFEAEERVDFRDLVRKLAARFHVRIDMRQIGVRDEARLVGGLGHCGQELCCKRLGGEFCPVSIRMAKEQDLSLNPQKISGVCGRLMCCLRYEFDAYKDFKSRAPKQNAQVETPLGKAKVVDLDVPREVVSLKLEGEKPVKVPLADFDPPEEGTRPNRVGAEAWQSATERAAMSIAGESTFLTSQFTEQDKLADPSNVRRTGTGGGGRNGGKRGGSGKGSSAGGNGSNGSNGGNGNGAQAGGNAAQAESRKPRRRRSTKVAADGSVQQQSMGTEGDASRRKQKPSNGQNQQQQKKQGQRKPASSNGKKGQAPRAADGAQPSANGGNGRKQGSRNGQGAPKSGPRPGQRSSGLRQQGSGAAQGNAGNAGAQNGSAGAPSEGGRRRRRRSHQSGGDGGSGSNAGNAGGSNAQGGSSPSTGSPS